MLILLACHGYSSKFVSGAPTIFVVILLGAPQLHFELGVVSPFVSPDVPSDVPSVVPSIVPSVIPSVENARSEAEKIHLKVVC